MKALTISHESIGLRFFLWTWEADPNRLNVCRLFWGTFFLPAGFFIKKSHRPFHCLSPLSAFYLTGMVIPGICFGYYGFAIVSFLFFLGSMLYIYVRREAIAKKCDQQEARIRASDEEDRVYEAELKAKIELGERIFSERTERILEIIFTPPFWLANFVIEVYEKFYDTRPGERIVGFLSLSYYFLKSVKQKTCFLIVVE